MKKKLDLKEILLPTLSLFVICLAITGALAVVNSVTAAPIAKNEALAADAARQELFPGARFEARGELYVAYEGETLRGYCVETQAKGYGGDIKVAVGLDPGGRVLQVKILAADGETPGLGQKVRESSWLAKFAGGGPFVLGGNIDAQTSATYSSTGVVNAVNQALEIYQREGGRRDERESRESKAAA